MDHDTLSFSCHRSPTSVARHRPKWPETESIPLAAAGRGGDAARGPASGRLLRQVARDESTIGEQEHTMQCTGAQQGAGGVRAIEIAAALAGYDRSREPLGARRERPAAGAERCRCALRWRLLWSCPLAAAELAPYSIRDPGRCSQPPAARRRTSACLHPSRDTSLPLQFLSCTQPNPPERGVGVTSGSDEGGSGRGIFSPSGLPKSLFQVLDEVVRVLQSDRKPDEAVGDAHGAAMLQRHP